MKKRGDLDPIITQFADQYNKNEITEVLKELFDKKKVELISDLEPDEIKLMTRILGISKMHKLQDYETVVFLFASLMLSKKGKAEERLLMQ